MKVLNGAAGTFAGMGREAEAAFASAPATGSTSSRRSRRWRVAAREQNEALAARVEALEAELKTKSGAAKKKGAGPAGADG